MKNLYFSTLAGLFSNFTVFTGVGEKREVVGEMDGYVRMEVWA